METVSPTFSPVISVTPSNRVCPEEICTGAFTKPPKPAMKGGSVAALTLKKGLAGAIDTFAVTCEKRNTTELELTRMVEPVPAVGFVTCILTVCPGKTFESVAKGMEASEAVIALKPFVSTVKGKAFVIVTWTKFPGAAAVSTGFPLTTVLFDKTSKIC